MSSTAFVGGFVVFLVILCIALAAFMIVSYWKLFQKAGQPGWAAIVPVYNFVVELKIANMSPWYAFILLASFIPFVGSLVLVAFSVWMNIRLGQAFSKGAGFIVGLCLLPIIFVPMLAFDSSIYEPAKINALNNMSGGVEYNA